MAAVTLALLAWLHRPSPGQEAGQEGEGKWAAAAVTASRPQTSVYKQATPFYGL